MRSGCTPLPRRDQRRPRGTARESARTVSTPTAPCERRPPRSSPAGRRTTPRRADPAGRSDHERVRIRRRRVGHRPRHLGPSRRRGVPVRRADGDGPRPRLAGRVRDGHAASSARPIPRRGRRGVWPRNAPPSWPAAWRSSASPSTRWLGYRDGECAAVGAAVAVDRLCEVIDDVGPDTVLTFGTDGITGHPDHQAVSAWATAAFARSAPPRAGSCTRRSRHGTRPDGRTSTTAWASTCPATRSPLPTSGWRSTWCYSGRRRPPGRGAGGQTTQTAGLLAAMGVDRYTASVGDESFVEHQRQAPVAGATGRGDHARVRFRSMARRATSRTASRPGTETADGGRALRGLVAGGRVRRLGRRRRRAGPPPPRRRAGGAGRPGCATSSTGGSSCRCARSSRPPRGSRSGPRTPAGRDRAASSPTDATPTRKVAPDRRRQLDGSDGAARRGPDGRRVSISR